MLFCLEKIFEVNLKMPCNFTKHFQTCNFQQILKRHNSFKTLELSQLSLLFSSKCSPYSSQHSLLYSSQHLFLCVVCCLCSDKSSSTFLFRVDFNFSFSTLASFFICSIFCLNFSSRYLFFSFLSILVFFYK